MIRKALFPGSFDPPTVGHVDIVKRALRIFDEVTLLIAINPEKKSLFSLDEKLGMLEEIFSDDKRVKVASFCGLTAEFARLNDIPVIIRGVRAQDDFNYEFEMAMNNRYLNKELDVIFIPTDQRYFLIRSSQIKEFASHGASVSGMVPEIVEKMLTGKYRK